MKILKRLDLPYKKDTKNHGLKKEPFGASTRPCRSGRTATLKEESSFF